MVRITDSTTSESSDSSSDVIVERKRMDNSTKNNRSFDDIKIWEEFESDEGESYLRYEGESCQCRYDYRGDIEEVYCPSCRKPVEDLDTYSDSEEGQVEDESTISDTGNEWESGSQSVNGYESVCDSDYEGDIEEDPEKKEPRKKVYSKKKHMQKI